MQIWIRLRLRYNEKAVDRGGNRALASVAVGLVWHGRETGHIERRLNRPRRDQLCRQDSRAAVVVWLVVSCQSLVGSGGWWRACLLVGFRVCMFRCWLSGRRLFGLVHAEQFGSFGAEAAKL